MKTPERSINREQNANQNMCRMFLKSLSYQLLRIYLHTFSLISSIPYERDRLG